jgi:hypothetical protein
MEPRPIGQPGQEQPRLEDAVSTFGATTANGPSTTGGESEGSTAQQAKDKAQETAQQAAGQAKGRIREQVDQRSTEAGERVSGIAQDVRSVGEELRKQGKDQPARLADQAAQRAESVGNYLTRSDGETILGDIEDFGRRQPWAVIAGGLALGFAASRFLKASSSRRYQSRYGESSQRLPARPQDVAPPSYGDVVPGGPPAPGTGGVSPVDTGLTAGAPTTRTGMAPGDATETTEYGGMSAGLPGRSPGA